MSRDAESYICTSILLYQREVLRARLKVEIYLSDSPMLRPISIFAITIRVSSAFGELGPFQEASVADIQFDSLNRIFDTRPLERRMETAKGL